MNLVVDVGNTNIKMALFDQNLLTRKMQVLSADLIEFERYFRKFAPYCKRVILSVVGDGEGVRDIINRLFPKFVEFTKTTETPLINDYQSPETLGSDRLAACVGAASLYDQSNILVFDAGSCLTWDFVEDGKKYKGGGISPGIDMRYRALHTFTKRLPLISDKSDPILFGRTTQESIIAGVTGGILAEVEGIINRFKDVFPDVQVVFTGGDTNYFDKKLKINIFAHPNLVLLGLNIILDFNAEQKN